MRRVKIHDDIDHDECRFPSICACECLICMRTYENAGRPAPTVDELGSLLNSAMLLVRSNDEEIEQLKTRSVEGIQLLQQAQAALEEALQQINAVKEENERLRRDFDHQSKLVDVLRGTSKLIEESLGQQISEAHRVLDAARVPASTNLAERLTLALCSP